MYDERRRDSRVNLILCRIWSHPQDSILRLQPNIHPLRQIISRQNRHAHSQITIETILQLQCCPFGNLDPPLLGRILLFGRHLVFALIRLGLAGSHKLNLLFHCRRHNTIDIDSRKVHFHRCQFAHFDNVFSFDDCQLGSASAETGECASGVSEYAVTGPVDFPCAQDGNVAFDGGFKDIVLAVEIGRLFPVAGFNDGLFLTLDLGRPPLRDTAAFDQSAYTSV